VWLNPPYDQDFGAWLAKAKVEVDSGRAEVVVALLPVRLDFDWWHESVLQHALEVRFLRKRIKYHVPLDLGKAWEPPYMTAIVVFNADGGPPLATTMEE
jgi:hypothetical protein